MNRFVISFIMTEVFILVSSMALLGKLHFYFSVQEATKRFKNLVAVFCIYLMTDICWAIIVYSSCPKSCLVLHVLSTIEFLMMGLIPYFWFLYVEGILNTHYYRKNILFYICKFLIIIYSIIALTSFKTGFIYSLDDNYNMIWGAYTGSIISSILLILFGSATFYGVINLFTSKNKLMIKKSLMVIGFIIPIALILYLYQKYRIAICIPQAIFTSIVLYFFSLEDQMSYIDELTGLFNRKKLNALYDEEKISNLKESLNTIYYIDVNDFKTINDTYGHAEGDKVLKIIGKAFLNLDKIYQSVAIRLGGDEFVVMICEDDIIDIDFKKVIRDEIEAIENEERFPHNIMTSIGQARLVDDSEHSLDICLRDADLDMYKDKFKNKK